MARFDILSTTNAKKFVYTTVTMFTSPSGQMLANAAEWS